MTEPKPIGYGSPPKATRFTKGQSGNPRGRPRNRHREIPHDALLGQMVTIREEGRERRVTAAEAFLLQLTQKGLAGDSAAARSSLEAIEAARGRQPAQQGIDTIVVVLIGMGIEAILGELRIAIKKYPRDENRANPAQGSMARVVVGAGVKVGFARLDRLSQTNCRLRES
ncbi:hypothetical protein EKN06_14655 [Croceicoccus ponticola]|uniref:DUF5681 domain-containing protein n=1 Tax=Croceicoccus ponticola TaxID=2217664 RepID=A0A437GUH3_9SPHN|nr:DUF5681 domain-containing protein [Croceicoccus ponticola]RVQ65033.1 hypothetical protein EKN06_14655 [Croceicoccus ponticola]